MGAPLNWNVDGRNWPHRDQSRFVEVGGIRWHIQQMGSGPAVLLLHGTGASSHSWRDVMPRLADRFTVIAPDLPGHGFTTGRPRRGLTLPGMVAAIDDLCHNVSMEPCALVGHSAGAAIAMGWGRAHPSLPVIGFNPALIPFEGVARQLFPAMARLFFLNPFVSRLFAARARVPGETDRFLRKATGSAIDAAGLRCYETLFGNDVHCSGALQMMAGWDLDELERTFPTIANPVLLVHSAGDRAVGLSPVKRAAGALSNAELQMLGDLGHLAHEEAPDAAVEAIVDFLQSAAPKARGKRTRKPA
ncbi:alpha/beta fold hydrolase BchO [Sphingomonas jaspsi]|uniref:alpha/beta fold hydrolase BchO n=1 Tax=Sphingomonas jaspsi TaxID=392409 RepID=UPI0004B5C182|nr:alpha/beta fold hydrolase BchO [Sphingomonas jaspsi]